MSQGLLDQGTAGVAFEDVTMVYRDGTEAVSSFNLAIPAGALCVLVGPSGSGKTTLLRIAAGLEEPTEGNVWIAGRDVTEEPPKRRDVAMVFQNFAIYPHMKVFDNIAFGLRARGRMPRHEVARRVHDAARLLGLDDVLKKRPRHLSGGQLQRLALGRAIVRDPKLFLMDEPLSNLDARLRDQMRSEILRIQRSLGVTTLYVTHDQAEAMALGDLVGVIHEGRLQQADTPQGLYERPRNLFVAAFIGTPPMNLVEATLEVDRGLWVRFGGQRLRIDPDTVTRRPSLSGYDRRQVILGIRPDHLDDVTLINEVPTPGTTISAVVSRRELIGSEVLLRFAVEAPLLMLRDPRDEGADPDRGAWAVERPNVFVARIDATSPAREGDQVELRVRPGELHLFDPETGSSIVD